MGYVRDVDKFHSKLLRMIPDKGGEKLCHVEMELDQWE